MLGMTIGGHAAIHNVDDPARSFGNRQAKRNGDVTLDCLLGGSKNDR
jgi:hypothetical protein